MNIMSIVSIVISVIVTLLFAIKQIKLYNANKRTLKDIRNQFAKEREEYSVNNQGKNVSITVNGNYPDLNKLLVEINAYLNRNQGTADFSVIHSKTELYASSSFENANAKVAFPTYLGLMGTFTGVFLGLLGFQLVPLFMGQNNDSGVSNLVFGVMISMATSLVGLVLTKESTGLAADCKKELDRRKYIFYNVIQTDVWGALGSSMNDALENLRQTVGQFEVAFSKSTDNFEKKFGESVKVFANTFDECTKHFGGEFQTNSKILTEAVTEMGHSIEKINANVESQRDLLNEFRSTEMWKSLEAFIRAADKLEASTKSIEELATLRTMLDESTEKMVSAQEEYIRSLKIAEMMSERIKNLLDRFSTFENSINNLGESIKMTDLTQRSELNELKRTLDNFLERKRIADEYTEKSTEELEEYFKHHTQSIAQLNNQYSEALEHHSEKFEDMMSDIAAAIQQKKREFIAALEDAFNIAELDTQFSHLNNLPEILLRLSELKATVIDKTTLLESMKEVVDEVRECNSSIERGNKTQNSTMEENTLRLMNKSEAVRKEVVSQNEKLQVSLQAENQNLVSTITARITEIGVSINNLQHNMEKYDSELCGQAIANMQELLNSIPFEKVDRGTMEQINTLLTQQKTSLNEFVEELKKQKSSLDLHKKVGELQKELDLLINKISRSKNPVKTAKKTNPKDDSVNDRTH